MEWELGRILLKMKWEPGRVSLSHPLIGLVCLLVWVLFGCVFLGLVVVVVVVVVFFVCLFSYLQDLSVVDSWVYLWPQAIKYKDCHYRHDERSNSPKKNRDVSNFSFQHRRKGLPNRSSRCGNPHAKRSPFEQLWYQQKLTIQYLPMFLFFCWVFSTKKSRCVGQQRVALSKCSDLILKTWKNMKMQKSSEIYFASNSFFGSFW